ncbi:hypothetical protein H5410_055908, partial [Solanum commersonii]
APPLVAGLAIVAAAYASRYGVQAWQAFKVRPPTQWRIYEGLWGCHATPELRRKLYIYIGGFQPKMSRMKAALILGVRFHYTNINIFNRESTEVDRVREAHRKVRVANHPNA